MIRWTTIAWAADVRPADKLVLLALARYANKAGQCWPSQAALAAETGLTERHVRRCLDRLKKARRLRVFSGRGRKHPNTYEILDPREDNALKPGPYVRLSGQQSQRMKYGPYVRLSENYARKYGPYVRLSGKDTNLVVKVNGLEDKGKTKGVPYGDTPNKRKGERKKADPPGETQRTLFGEPATPSSGASLRAHVEEVCQAWNKTADRCGFVPCRRIATGTTRWTYAVARVADAGWWSEYRDALDRLQPTPFLTGRTARGWRANIEWFLRPNTVDKILEGLFDPHEPGPPRKLDR